MRVVGIDGTFWGKVRAARGDETEFTIRIVCGCVHGQARVWSVVESCWPGGVRRGPSFILYVHNVHRDSRWPQSDSAATELLPDSLSTWLGGGGDGGRAAAQSMTFVSLLLCTFS